MPFPKHAKRSLDLASKIILSVTNGHASKEFRNEIIQIFPISFMNQIRAGYIVVFLDFTFCKLSNLILGDCNILITIVVLQAAWAQQLTGVIIVCTESKHCDAVRLHA